MESQAIAQDVVSEETLPDLSRSLVECKEMCCSARKVQTKLCSVLVETYRWLATL